MKNIIIIILLLQGFATYSQNLVPNGDFEFYSSCPTGASQINLAVPWYDPNGATSDYCNGCALVSSGANVPNQSIGFQYAHSGVGFASLYGSQSHGDYREYIQVKLTDSLKSDSCYYAEFYINLFNFSGYGINNMGAVTPLV